MNANKILLGGIIGGVAFFLLGWLIYGIVLSDFMSQNGNQCAMRSQEQFIWWSMIVSNILSAIFLALIFSWSNTVGFLGGIKMGAIIGLFLGLSMDLSFYSMSTIFNNLTAVVVDVLAYVVMTAVAGGIIAWVMGMGSKD